MDQIYVGMLKDTASISMIEFMQPNQTGKIACEMELICVRTYTNSLERNTLLTKFPSC